MCKKNQKKIIFLFLAQFFISRIFIGTMADQYNEMPQIQFNWLNYIIDLLLIVFFAFHKKNTKTYFIMIFMFFVLLFELIQQFIILMVSDVFMLQTFITFGRIYMLILANLIFLFYYYNKKYFIIYFLFYVKITIFVSLSSLFLYYSIGSTLQVYIGRGFPRIQGLLSEPSAMAASITSAIYLSIYLKKKILFIFSLITAILTYSSTVYFSIFLVGSYLFVNNLVKNAQKAIYLYIKIFIIFLLFFFIYIFINMIFSTSINLNTSSNIFSIFDRIDLVFKELANIKMDNLDYLLALHLDRLWGILMTIHNLYMDNLEYIGYGLNGSQNIFIPRYDDIIDYGMLAFMISSFGIIIGPFVVLLCFFIIRKILTIDYEIGVILLSYYFATLFNSAGGIIFYSLVFAFVIYYMQIIYRIKYKEKMN